jgi:hypothetical protein
MSKFQNKSQSPNSNVQIPNDLREDLRALGFGIWDLKLTTTPLLYVPIPLPAC